jgi:hypothetical protein
MTQNRHSRENYYKTLSIRLLKFIKRRKIVVYESTGAYPPLQTDGHYTIVGMNSVYPK